MHCEGLWCSSMKAYGLEWPRKNLDDNFNNLLLLCMYREIGPGRRTLIWIPAMPGVISQNHFATRKKTLSRGVNFTPKWVWSKIKISWIICSLRKVWTSKLPSPIYCCMCVLPLAWWTCLEFRNFIGLFCAPKTVHYCWDDERTIERNPSSGSLMTSFYELPFLATFFFCVDSWRQLASYVSWWGKEIRCTTTTTTMHDDDYNFALGHNFYLNIKQVVLLEERKPFSNFLSS